MSVPQPLIAAVHGYVLGSGLEIALFCDIRIASDDIQISVPEMGLGIITAAGASQTLPRAVNRGPAMEMLLSGRRIKAAEALQIRLVNQVVSGAELLPAAQRLADRIKTLDQAAVRGIKEAVGRGTDMSLDEGLELEARLAGRLLDSNLALSSELDAGGKMNTGEFLTITSAICPDKEGIVFENKRLSYSQLNDRVNRLGNALLKLGLRKGNPVALMQVNTNQCVESYFAVAKAGGIYVPLNFRAKGNELIYMLNTAEATTVLVGERYLDLIDSIKSSLPTVKNYISLDRPASGHAVLRGPDCRFVRGRDLYRDRGRRYHYSDVHRRHYRFPEGGNAHPQQLLDLRAGERHPG